jgi:hypothetical protein
MKKVTLISNWKTCYKLPSFQIAVALIILEGMQAFYVFMPDDIANPIRAVLVTLLPVVRLIKSQVKDDV